MSRDFYAGMTCVNRLMNHTECWMMEGEVGLSAIKDCESNRIVGYAIGGRMMSELAVNALRIAIILRSRPAGTIVPGDKEGQFRSNTFRTMLRNNGPACSMGRVVPQG